MRKKGTYLLRNHAGNLLRRQRILQRLATDKVRIRINHHAIAPRRLPAPQLLIPSLFILHHIPQIPFMHQLTPGHHPMVGLDLVQRVKVLVRVNDMAVRFFGAADAVRDSVVFDGVAGIGWSVLGDGGRMGGGEREREGIEKTEVTEGKDGEDRGSRHDDDDDGDADQSDLAKFRSRGLR